MPRNPGDQPLRPSKETVELLIEGNSEWVPVKDISECAQTFLNIWVDYLDQHPKLFSVRIVLEK